MFFSNSRRHWLELKTHHGRAISGTPIRRRNLSIRAEVNFVNAEEAKKLIEAEGYAILDIRDKYQFDRAHIKSCCHVPLFIENKDNDPSKIFYTHFLFRVCLPFEIAINSLFFSCADTIIKRTLHNNFSGLFYGLPFTKPNPEFVQSVKSQFSPESKLLLVCQEGLRLVLTMLWLV